MDGHNPSVKTKRVKLEVLVPVDTNVTRVKAKKEEEADSQEFKFQITEEGEVNENDRFAHDQKRSRRVSAALGKAPKDHEEITPPDFLEEDLFELENNDPPPTRSEFLAEVRKEILDAIFKKTANTGKTTSSLIQQYQETMIYYDNMEEPFHKITPENSITGSRTSRQCKVCGHKLLGSSATNGMRLHVEKLHMFVEPLVCPYCNASFSNQRNLKHHLETAHIVPTIGSYVYVQKTDSMKLECVKFTGLETQVGPKMSQLYFIKWMKKVEGKEEVVGMSVDMTTLKDVTVAASNLWRGNLSGAKTENEGNKLPKCCSYRHRINEGWYFNSTEATPLGIFGDNEAAGSTLKWFARIVTNADCHQRPESGLFRTVLCQDAILNTLKQNLLNFPEENQKFFNNEQWKARTTFQLMPNQK